MNTPKERSNRLDRMKERMISDAIQILAIVWENKLLILSFGIITYTALLFLFLTINTWPELAPIGTPLGFMVISICGILLTQISSNPRTRKIALALPVALFCASGLFAAVIWAIG